MQLDPIYFQLMNQLICIGDKMKLFVIMYLHLEEYLYRETYVFTCLCIVPVRLHDGGTWDTVESCQHKSIDWLTRLGGDGASSLVVRCLPSTWDLALFPSWIQFSFR